MKFIIERAKLLPSLAHIQSVVERRNTIPILSNVLLRAEKWKTLPFRRMTDMDLEIVESVPAIITDPGATTAPAHTLYDIVRKLQDGSNIEFETNAGDRVCCRVRGGRSEILPGLSADRRFPANGGTDHAWSAAWPRGRTAHVDRPGSLRDLDRGNALLPERHLSACGQVRRRAWCCALSRPTAKAGAGRDAAAQRRRRHAGRDRAPQDRRRSAQVAGRCDRRRSRSRCPTRKLRFSSSTSVVLTSKLIDGTFPDYERVIPSGNDKLLEVNPRGIQPARSTAVGYTIATDRRLQRGEADHRPGFAHRFGQQLRERQRETEELESRLYLRPRSRSASTSAICWISPSR